MPIFSNNLKYMIYHDLPPSIRICKTSKYAILVVIIKGKILFRVPLTFSESRYPCIGRLGIFIDALSSFLLTIIILVIFIFTIPLNDRLAQGAFLVIVAMYLRFPLLASLSSSLVPMSATFEGDLFLNSSLSWLPPLMYSNSQTLLISLLIVSYIYMQLFMLWSWPFDLVCSEWLSNGKMGPNSSFLELCFITILIYIFLWAIQ